jgi:secreted Zn-dependent insulinase-like peptidase
MQFEFSDKGSAMRTCVATAGRMHVFTDENIHDINRTKYVVDDFNPEQLKTIAESLCDPKGLNILMRSQSFKDTPLVSETEEWYGTKYKVTPFSDELIDKIANPKCEIKSKKLDLPPPNTMIPKNFDVLPEASEFS